MASTSHPSPPGPECIDANVALDFVEGLCTPEQVKAIEQHVDGCSLCRQLLSALARDNGDSPPLVSTGKSHGDGAEPQASHEERLVAARLERGRSVGRYMLLDQLGVGGMGVVYSAYDPELDRKVAVKLLRVGTARHQEGQARMLREAQAMARLQHPNVLGVFDAGTFGDEVFIAMELVEGSTLTQWLAAEKRSWKQVLGTFLSAARGLAAAHSGGLVHRDFKPDNVLISKDGRVRVTDFGLARDVSAAEAAVLPLNGIVVRDSVQLTRTGVLLGTPAYMAPEQFLGGTVDARTDQFSFCVALYEALHGERPFQGQTWEALRDSVLNHQVASPPKGASVPPWLRRVLLRGLSAEPSARFDSMEALLAELERAPLAQRRRRVAVAGLVVLMGLGAVGYRDVQQRRDMCMGAATRFAGIWDAPRKQAIEQTFLATKQPYAQDAWAAVQRVLDGYTARWTQQWTESCTATWVEQQQPEEVMKRRDQCLNWRREKVKALTDLLAQASASEVREAASVVSTLPGLEACSAEGVQSAAASGAQKPEVSPEAEALRTQLARLETLHAARRDKEALELASSVHTHARALGDRALEAESLFWRGVKHMNLQENKEAEQLLMEATLAAETLGLDELKARSQTELVWVYGLNLHQVEPALLWGRHAQATIDRLGGAPNLQFELYRNLGAMRLQEARYAEAAEDFKRVLELAASVLGEDHPRMAGMWSNYGLALSTMGQYEQADQAMGHALELATRWLGPRHPRVANIQLNIVFSHMQQKRPDEALPLAHAALATYEQLQGPEGKDVGRALMFTAYLHLVRKEYALALEKMERSVAVTRKAFGPDSLMVSSPLAGLGHILSEQGRHTEALPYLQQALRMQIQENGPKHLALAATLQAMGHSQLALGQATQAIASFERALGLEDVEKSGLWVLADTRFGLARALGSRPEQRERARQLALQAREFYARSAWHSEEKAEVEAWLAQLPPAQAPMK